MAPPADRPPLLEMRHVSKTFGAIRALKDVQLTAYGGQVHVLMGENGARQSTLMKVHVGANRPDPGGEIRIDGKPAAIVDPSSAKSAGVAIIYQELSLAPNLTVLENIYLGREARRGLMIDRRRMSSGGEILVRLGVSFVPRQLAGDLLLAYRRP